MENNALQTARDTAAQLMSNVESVIVGNYNPVRLIVIALLCRGHVLIEGPPGVGKTTLARSLALSINGGFKRIQCTSDLLPSDITGTYVFDQKESEFRFRPGPILTNLVLIDELDRASPRTQSALLECMEEHQVTVDGITHTTPEPFYILATRNPAQHGGTFPLLETELDRFLLRVKLDYPHPDDEAAMVGDQLAAHPITSVQPVTDLGRILAVQQTVRTIYVDKLVMDYAVAIVNATRVNASVHLGASPRATIGMVTLAQAHALLVGREFVLHDDIKAVATPALGHRIILTAEAKGRTTSEQLIQRIVESIPIDHPKEWMDSLPLRSVSNQTKAT